MIFRGLCDKRGKNIEALLGVPSISKTSGEVQATPPPTPPRKVHQEIDTWELETNLRSLTAATQMEGELAGREEKGRSMAEAGMGTIKREHDNIPGGWELIWVEDPLTGKWERVKVPREEADYC